MKSFQYISRDMTGPEVIELPQGQLTIFTRSSPVKTSGNEDCAAVISIDDESSLLIVADGMGGHANGAAASEYITQLLEDNVSKTKLKDTALREAVLRSIESANYNLLRKKQVKERQSP
jgi:serine/threonine protein phosphatase PrpC